MPGLIVHGDNHFVVRGPRPDRSTVSALVRHWSVIQIGHQTPHELEPWKISTQEFREDLEWVWIVGDEAGHSSAVIQLLQELAGRGVPFERA